MSGKGVDANDLQAVITAVLAVEPRTASGEIDPWHAAEEIIDALREVGWVVMPNPDDPRPVPVTEFINGLTATPAAGPEPAAS